MNGSQVITGRREPGVDWTDGEEEIGGASENQGDDTERSMLM